MPEARTGGGTPRPVPALRAGIEPLQLTQPAPVTGEVPDELLENILDDLSARLGIDPQEIEVVKGEAVVWSDGSLGCPKPGEFYTQEVQKGYWLVFKRGDATYDYRVSERGAFFLCEPAFPPLLATTGPLRISP
jgi:hypothetical protein